MSRSYERLISQSADINSREAMQNVERGSRPVQSNCNLQCVRIANCNLWGHVTISASHVILFWYSQVQAVQVSSFLFFTRRVEGGRNMTSLQDGLEVTVSNKAM